MQQPGSSQTEPLDCLIVGGGPGGLTGALYLARFGRSALLVDAGRSRAGWIPVSHNIPLFADGISGAEILSRQRAHVARYGGRMVAGDITHLARIPGGFRAAIRTPDGNSPDPVEARHVLLATGAEDVEPDFPDLPDAIRRGLVRYCPICDGYEARNQRIAVIGHGARGLGEAEFLARTYTPDVTLLTLGCPLGAHEQGRARRHGIALVQEPVTRIDVEDDRITVLNTADGARHRFAVLYSALGLTLRSGLAVDLGAEHDDAGAIVVDAHNRTSVPGLYAAGGVVRGLDQVVVAMAHGAVAATDIHNRCALPTEDEAGGTA
ncbi:MULTISPECIES: NAD(P)/FAD-dependent oxidoreductase [unclassified Methylobacterium]|jgi:thioredoxin reductase (NADPH)|uniref:NAD(P)/FAD-dependent oxidoreductase n=1 Tax=unclassified Methylobacterium TaxID=2615210 RepID=UPI001352AFD8|nr:NAD(P)/FAD-dependent oxidoreductase [Methylobacterium sp. 2A]MWV24022.1 NAD(P)/FAD-dependent oxidoreductase [Methylobacterium sp. 2A]